MSELDNFYPANWPRCPTCGNPALDGHITCGDVACNERRARTNAYERALESGRHLGFVKHYRNILTSVAMTPGEKAGYIHAASMIDYRVPEVTIEEARTIVALYNFAPRAPA